MEKKKANETINVTPDSIFFRDVACGDSDSVDMWIHNFGKKPVSIRLKMPADSASPWSAAILKYLIASFIFSNLLLSTIILNPSPLFSNEIHPFPHLMQALRIANLAAIWALFHLFNSSE